MVGEGFGQVRKKLVKLDICRNSLIRLSATFSLRRRQKTNWLLHTEKIKFINKINDSKTIARFERGGTTQVVGEGLANIIKSYKN